MQLKGTFFNERRTYCLHPRLQPSVFVEEDLEVAKSTLKQLKALDVGSWKNEKYGGTRIPTISEVFATVRREEDFR